jgi:hypothetical protein
LGGYKVVQDIAVGDADNDGKIEVYASTVHHWVYQIEYEDGSWNMVGIGQPDYNIRDTLVCGDGDSDGMNEVYATGGEIIYSFRWNGEDWVMSGHRVKYEGYHLNFYRLAIGDADNDGVCELYGGRYHIYQLKWNGAGWTAELVGTNTEILSDLIIADIDNDGECELYCADRGGKLLQFIHKDGWEKREIIEGGENQEKLSCGDADNDGIIEIYTNKKYGSIICLKPTASKGIPKIVLKKQAEEGTKTIAYTITYENIGGETATDVIIVDVIPERCKIQSAKCKI